MSIAGTKYKRFSAFYAVVTSLHTWNKTISKLFQRLIAARG